jgi:hypothetical protein
MTTRSLKIQAALFLAVVVIGDLWLLSLRCSASPDVDWSRLSFALIFQALAIAFPLVLARFADLAAPHMLKLAGAAVVALVASFPLVWTPLLLSDTVANKFFHSSAYECPRMWHGRG